jgi:hypothetical protein
MLDVEHSAELRRERSSAPVERRGLVVRLHNEYWSYTVSTWMRLQLALYAWWRGPPVEQMYDPGGTRALAGQAAFQGWEPV